MTVDCTGLGLSRKFRNYCLDFELLKRFVVTHSLSINYCVRFVRINTGFLKILLTFCLNSKLKPLNRKDSLRQCFKDLSNLRPHLHLHQEH